MKVYKLCVWCDVSRCMYDPCDFGILVLDLNDILIHVVHVVFYFLNSTLNILLQCGFHT